MTVVGFTRITPKVGVNWDDFQKDLRKGMAIVRRHGGENVTLLSTIIGGDGVGTMGVLVTTETFEAYGKLQDAFWVDPEVTALLAGPDSKVEHMETTVAVAVPEE